MEKNKKIHIIGICGIGMSAIAQYLSSNHIVQGSDASINNSIADRLRGLSIKVLANSSDNISEDIDLIVKSTAIKKDDPELLAAGELGILVWNRAKMMKHITLQSDCVISISGAHGKTTTTTMTGELLHYMGKNPTIFSGGVMGFCDNNYKSGDQNLMVVEADESDGTFMQLKSDIAVLTNIDFEHAEYYKDLQHMVSCCETFLNGDSVQKAVICGDDPVIKQLNITNKDVIRYGFSQENNIRAKDIDGNSSTLVINNVEFKDFKLRAHGKHNILNTLAAISAAVARFGLSDELISAARQMTSNFQGVARRFNILKDDNITVIDDYAHHPTEIAATIAAARSMKTQSRIIAIVQPHRYTRLQALMSDFVNCTADADVTIISDVYTASESPIDGVSGEVLASQIVAAGRKCYHRSGKDEIFSLLNEIILDGDIVLFMGAGTVTNWAKDYAAHCLASAVQNIDS